MLERELGKAERPKGRDSFKGQATHHLCGSAQKNTTSARQGNVFQHSTVGYRWSWKLNLFLLYPSLVDAREGANAFEICNLADVMMDGSKTLQGNYGSQG